jgi:hypothetical protein
VSDQEFDQYLSTRFCEVVKFYDTRAQQNKLGHRVCSVSIIIVSAVLAPLISTGILSDHQVLGGFLSASIVVASAIMAHFQFNENWLSYRATWDALQREPHLRAAGLGEYSDAADRNALFVQRVESIAAREGSEWLARHSQTERKPKSDT